MVLTTKGKAMTHTIRLWTLTVMTMAAVMLWLFDIYTLSGGAL